MGSAPCAGPGGGYVVRLLGRAGEDDREGVALQVERLVRRAVVDMEDDAAVQPVRGRPPSRCGEQRLVAQLEAALAAHLPCVASVAGVAGNAGVAGGRPLTFSPSIATMPEECASLATLRWLVTGGRMASAAAAGSASSVSSSEVGTAALATLLILPPGQPRTRSRARERARRPLQHGRQSCREMTCLA